MIATTHYCTEMYVCETERENQRNELKKKKYELWWHILARKILTLRYTEDERSREQTAN